MMTLLEAARHNPPLFSLRYDRKFILDLRRRYFSDYEGDTALLEDSLWNRLESAAEIYFEITDKGILQADVQAAQFVLKKLKPVIEKLWEDGGENLHAISLGLLYLIDRKISPTEEINSVNDYQDIRNLILDGKRFRETLFNIATLIEISEETEAPRPYRKSRYDALKAWSICMGMFWISVALKKITLKKESVEGGVEITSQFGIFSEECLSEIGIDTHPSLRSPLEYAQRHLKADSEFQSLLSRHNYAGAAEHLKNRTDRFPIAML